MLALLAGFSVEPQVVVNGIITGLTYGVLAVGLILVYRSTRVVNLAYGEIGAFAAALLVRMVVNWDLGFFLSLATALVVGAAIGAAMELGIIRRLAKAPRVIVLVATMGAAQLILFAQLQLPALERFDRFPTPLRSTWQIGDVVLRSEHILVLLFVPAVTIGLTLFLNRTKYGTAVRAAAANQDAARLASINVKSLSTLVWAMAGALAALTAILIAPIRSTPAAATAALGPALLLRALTPALVARMRSMPIALLTGVVIGVGEALLFFNVPDEPGLIDLALFVVVIVAVFTVVRSERNDGQGTWRFSPRTKPMPARLESLWWARHFGHLLAGVALAVAVVLPLLIDRPSRHVLWARVLLYALVGLSLTALAGWAGQLSLGQFAFVGWSAMVTAALVNGTSFRVGDTLVTIASIPFELAVPIAVASTVLVAIMVGAPALRIPGLFLAVTTLAFAVMAQTWLLERPVFTNGEAVLFVPRARWGDAFSLESQRTFYYLCLVALVLGIVVMRRLRASGIGRSLVAVRENEAGAAAFTVSPARTKLMAFGVSGAYAGVAGALLVSLVGQIQPDRLFTPEESLRVVAITVIGGLSSIGGAVVGSLWVIGLPAFFDNSQEIQLLTSGIGVVILLMYVPGGLVQIGYATRDAFFGWLARRLPEGDAAPLDRTTIPARARPAARAEVAPGTAALSCQDVSVNFGGRVAVDGVSLTVGTGEVVGLIGTNGAGKSTLMNAVGGLVPATGQVTLLGRRLDGLSPARRARAGLGRTFQTADLFGDLTVRETVQVALEARGRTGLTATVLGLPRARRAERAKRAEADELVAFFGLGRYADHFVSDLSTGTRRIVELACMLALDARVLCLDEPTAGVAQRETEAFAPLLLRIRDELDASLLVIEHDMPFIMGISDRVYCLEAGRVIAEGDPAAIRSDPLVIASYLGTDERAIMRSETKRVDVH